MDDGYIRLHPGGMAVMHDGYRAVVHAARLGESKLVSLPFVDIETVSHELVLGGLEQVANWRRVDAGIDWNEENDVAKVSTWKNAQGMTIRLVIIIRGTFSQVLVSRSAISGIPRHTIATPSMHMDNNWLVMKATEDRYLEDDVVDCARRGINGRCLIRDFDRDFFSLQLTDRQLKVVTDWEDVDVIFDGIQGDYSASYSTWRNANMVMIHVLVYRTGRASLVRVSHTRMPEVVRRLQEHKMEDKWTLKRS